ncbi:dienelactone hydrolase family protein [Sphingomonas sp.]|uniref:dienelactone hydrolase family protein n=1 Tax=Sphingomonas sp. TaxID=28214 RepID=UPI002DD63104|nr:dienelactone hydrolase family protein [Sphingomonas sp.]
MLIAVAAVVTGAAVAPVVAQKPKAEAVAFLSADQTTQLRGYLFKPGKIGAAMPAVVIMHGIGGAYSPEAKGKYDATTLSLQYKNWIDLLLKNGFVVLMVDDYGPVGYPAGLAGVAAADRPPASDPVDARPLHSFGALRYLQSRNDVASGRVGLIGWQLGGSAVLAAMRDNRSAAGGSGFAAGVAVYPSCSRLVGTQYKASGPGPVRIFMGDADKVLSVKDCATLAANGKASGSDIELRTFEGAGHNYASLAGAIRSVPANAKADAATRSEVITLFSTALKN